LPASVSMRTVSDATSMTILALRSFFCHRSAGDGCSRLSPAPAAARTRRADCRGHRRESGARRRGRDGYRQDLRLPGAGAALGRQGDRFHRDPETCRISCSRATSRPSAKRSSRRSRWRCSRGAPTTCATITSNVRWPTAASSRAMTPPTRSASRASPARRAAATRPNVPMSRRTRRCGPWSPRRATTAWGRTARRHKECFVLAARREALAADLVVVNHHLFFADVMLRDEGTAELLPACNTVIFDEAHQLPEVASLFFGDSLSTAATARTGSGYADRRSGFGTRLPGPAARLCSARESGPRPAAHAAGGAGALPSAATRRAQWVCRCPGRPDPRTRSAGRAAGDAGAAFAEGLENCWRRASRSCWPCCAAGRSLANDGVDNADFVSLGRDLQHIRCSSTRRRWSIAEHHAEADERPPAGVDLHFGDARRAERFRPLLRRDGTDRRRARRRWESPFDYARQAAALRADGNLPDPNSLRPTPRRWSKAAFPVDAGQRRERFLPVHLAACDAPHAHELLRRVAGARRTRSPRCCCRARAARTNCSSAFADSATPS
jgi:hypothetical protein